MRLSQYSTAWLATSILQSTLIDAAFAGKCYGTDKWSRDLSCKQMLNCNFWVAVTYFGNPENVLEKAWELFRHKFGPDDDRYYTFLGDTTKPPVLRREDGRYYYRRRFTCWRAWESGEPWFDHIYNQNVSDAIPGTVVLLRALVSCPTDQHPKLNVHCCNKREV